ncbi:SMI1/KNR4 family protein [Streptomyces sp. NPDC005279]|uniref:SMI1/KNR4 family protein n=1 Tax=Streptomyces sp. NPDC005279 TaxID=3364712 RepID=UPI003674D7CD
MSQPPGGAMSSLEQLRSLLGEPEVWGWARPELWAASERRLGVSLPLDYKAFMDLYGPGGIDEYLWLIRPMDSTAVELDQLWSLEGRRRARSEAPDLYPYPFHPDSGGLIPWGSDEQGSAYYFLAAERKPEEWRIVVHSECNDWYETAGTFTDFLTRCFDRTDRPPFMARAWPRSGAGYVSLA